MLGDHTEDKKMKLKKSIVGKAVGRIRPHNMAGGGKIGPCSCPIVPHLLVSPDPPGISVQGALLSHMLMRTLRPER